MLFNIILTLLLSINTGLAKTIRNLSYQPHEKENIGIKIAAKSGIAINGKSREMMFGKNENEALPIASITKLMTALVFLDYNQGWDKEIEIIGSDYRIGGMLYVSPGEIVTVRDLFYTSLAGSANNATVALARSTGMTLEEFADKLNDKAKELGMEKSFFVEPTGLSEKNVSTAEEVARLASVAFSKEEIREALQKDEHIFYTVDKKRYHRIRNTDKLLDSFLNKDGFEVIGAKTGYTDEARYCLAVGVESEAGDSVISVILGANTPEERFQEAKSLAWWALSQESNKTRKQ
ncbi:hypothetical protein A2Y83_04155 [Candidatus Falkowbacteria bacterium RBG_13_39_14]|uniref:Peptidase S11 D-alanyl-D-alanine carboxypeptidase A N-terminal domain-containing protein n=1 Tax=Candidatus Falkowbacteria bacterium RBG_13_39_14 TaxID=1797985 RepID=A0A1F5S6Y7_9BACT|nr:MAG: hypothetical protein A2Y83_04155 [Candidatus Falkowbacteria bacterium RBG_13_39_14]